MSRIKFVTSALLEGIRIAFQALVANKTRSALTTLGIIIGVLTVTLMMMIIQGLNRSFTKQISFLGSNTVYVERYPWVWDEDWWKFINRPKITMDEYEFLRERMASTVEAMSATIWTRRPASYRDRHADRITIAGVTRDAAITWSWVPEYGRFLSHTDIRAGRRVCLIGTDVQDQLFGAINPLGRELRIGGHQYKVIGILERKGKSFGQSLDDAVLIPISTHMNQFGRHRSVEIQIRGHDDASQRELIDNINRYFRQARSLKPLEDNDFSINKQDVLQDLYKQITAGVYSAGLVIGGISLLVGGIGIMNIMLVSVAERTWEVGLRKALGARTSHILWQFLVEAVLICTAGGSVGIVLAYIGGEIIKTTDLDAFMPVWLLFGAVGFSMTIGVIFGLFPAIKAARMDPIVALRQE
ncbi:FtsX-like permease family protein [bacterium]|nr:FtsX-like permease family protein [bacterium]